MIPFATMERSLTGDASRFTLLHSSRAAQRAWAECPVHERLKTVRNLRHLLAARGAELAALVISPWRSSPVETLAAEVLPLADACRFLESEAERLLAPQRRWRGRPAWMSGVRLAVHRDPHGVVLILSPSNYPLFLAAVQALQAVVAGNAVWLKPAPGTEASLLRLVEWWREGGLPEGLVTVLDSSVETGRSAVAARPDHVVVTGSLETGQAILSDLAGSVTPATVELSGCDAVFLLPGADLDLVARALVFGMTWNRGATCIAPHRVLATLEQLSALEVRLHRAISQVPPGLAGTRRAEEIRWMARESLSLGARLAAGTLGEGEQIGPAVLAEVTPAMPVASADLMVPLLNLMPAPNPDVALDIASRSPYALGAAVFGPTAEAAEFAARIPAGVVVINDVIAPTADPRVPFGGRGLSGFGVTRGPEGLLAMTRPKAIVERTTKFLPHLEGIADSDAELFTSYLSAVHGPKLSTRLGAGFRLVRSLWRKSLASRTARAVTREEIQ